MKKPIDDKVQVANAAGAVSGATFISRILGLLRDIIIAQFFGTKMAADAFFVAFRIPNLLRRLLGEGGLTPAIVPVFTEYHLVKSKDEVWNLANILLNTFLLILFVTVTMGVIFSPTIVRVIAPGFFASPEKFNLTIQLTRMMFPYLFFISMAALTMGMLNSLQVFFIPALSPVFLNISIILFALLLAPHLDVPVFALAAGVVVGGMFQLFIQLPPLIKKGLKYRALLDFNHEGLRRICKLMLASLFGLAATEINIFVDTLLASFLPEGSVSYLYFGNRLVQFPQGIFAVALGVAIIPTLSRQVTQGKIGKLKETLSFAIQLILFVTIPATVGLIVLKESIINLLFEWGGEFDRLSTIGTASALFYYSIGLCAFSGIKIIVPAFYSLKDSLTPVRIGVYAMILNVFLNVMLMGPLLHGGLALATSLSALFNVVLLVFILRKRIGGLQGRKILKSTVKLLIVSTIMGFVIYSIDNSFYHLESNILLKVGVLFGNIAFGVVLYLVLSFFVINDEVRFLMDLARNKISSNSCQMRK